MFKLYFPTSGLNIAYFKLYKVQIHIFYLHLSTDCSLYSTNAVCKILAQMASANTIASQTPKKPRWNLPGSQALMINFDTEQGTVLRSRI